MLDLLENAIILNCRNKIVRRNEISTILFSNHQFVKMVQTTEDGWSLVNYPNCVTNTSLLNCC